MLKKLSASWDVVKDRKSNNMLLLFRYERLKDGSYNLTSVKGGDFSQNENIYIEQWISQQSLDPLQDLSSPLIAKLADMTK